MSAPPTKPGGAWYRQPFLWFGIAVFAASIAGCAWIIVAGARSADIPLQTAPTVFGVPTHAGTAHAPPAR